jgi:Alkaline phosphatase
LKNYLVGTETTFSANAAVTDSAAGGTALSSGYKTKNGYVGIDPDGKVHATLLEAAQAAGKRTGICTTSEWTNATPATFTAHNSSRDNYEILSEQIVNQGLDVVLGSGFGAAKWGSIQEAENRNYTILNNRDDLAKVKSGEKIWGNLAKGSLPFDIQTSSSQATLAEMTNASIQALDGNQQGFFLMVEGSHIDSGGHLNNILQAVSEYLAFDAAFQVAVKYAQSRTDTIVVVAPDHDTGGLILPNSDAVGGSTNSADYSAAVNEVREGKNSTQGISWTSGNHTARRCGIWVYAPEGVALIPGLSETPGDTPETRNLIIDNTEISHYIEQVSGLNLEEATKQLYVDVTDRGTYDPASKTFAFDNDEILVKSNQSTAVIQGISVDLNGEIAVLSDSRFYVPERLLQFADTIKNETKSNNQIRILIDGKQLDLDVAPQIINDRTMVPFRKIFEALGAEVSWDDTTKTATGKKDGLTVQLTVGSDTAVVNNVPTALEVAAVIEDGRTLVPARFVSEQLGCNVEWDSANQVVIITTKNA